MILMLVSPFQPNTFCGSVYCSFTRTQDLKRVLFWGGLTYYIQPLCLLAPCTSAAIFMLPNVSLIGALLCSNTHLELEGGDLILMMCNFKVALRNQSDLLLRNCKLKLMITDVHSGIRNNYHT